MEFQQILELIHAVSDSGLTQFQLQEGDWKLSIKTEKKQKTVSDKEMSRKKDSQAEKMQEFSDSEKQTETGKTVRSPLVGTFYRSPSPEEEPFVKTGDYVKKGQILGIVEAMKLMNEIEAEFEGTVKEILTENGSLVEYGQPLFVLE